MKAWILAARPKTLPAAIVPVWVGSAPSLLGEHSGTGSWLLFWCTLGSCICIQIATNLFNDAIDHHKGADTGKRIGPTRVTSSGLLSSKMVMIGAIAFCLLAALISIPLVQARGWPVIVIGLVSLYFAYGYTGGPFPLAYRGMGELFVILFFGLVAVLGSAFIQTGEAGGREMWILAVQCGFYSCVLIAINNLRDLTEDRETGKRTLAVRFGERFAKWEIAFFCLAPAIPGLVQFPDMKDLFVQPIPMLAFGLFLSVLIFRTPPGPVYNRFLALGALQLILFAILQGV
ncbi:MAG: 1,4-dihydroxy-2-naphthoate octaprenyltransferase [Verrucomicrobiales bacterium]|nr:1,4-dihydroxy-2-naphthoate octaprenyltransferase [Verrucomicrobiales bacterium]